MATSDRSCTFKEVKEYLLGTLSRQKTGDAARENAWMIYMPPPSDNYNEVYPNILLGDSKLAKDPEGLKSIGVTHVVNCAQGKKLNQVDTNQDFFEESGIRFHGFVATDILTFKMTPHFQAAADFMDEALGAGGKLYVHCISGVSRSATIVLAFLMSKRDLSLLEAVKIIRDKRKILPNDGFLNQLVDFNNKLYGCRT